MVSSKGNVETRFAVLRRGTSRLGTLCGVFAMLVLATGCDPCLNNPCDDGVFCNGVEACTADGSAFACAAGETVTCDAGLTCDEDTSACVDPCEGVDCDDMNLCTTDTCADGVCSNVDEGCDDSDACTENDACDATDGTCAGTAIDCGEGMQCDATDGACIGSTCAVDTDCDDMSACTTDTCDATTLLCVFTAVDCDDSVNCTVDTCDPTNGCMNTAVVCPDGETCSETDGTCGAVTCATDADCADDGLFCNGTESCDTTNLVCTSSGNPCATGTTCDEATDSCTNTNVPETLQLTTSNDTLVGTAGDTLFDGQLFLTSGGNFVQTIGSADSLDGGAGNNTLSMQTNSATLVSPTLLKNIQTIAIQNTAAAANLNAVNADSITTINSNNSTNNTTVTGVQTAPTTFGSTNTAATVLSVTCTDTALAGTTDAATFNVSGVTGGVHVFQPTTASSSGYETMTVNSIGGAANVLAGLSQGNGNSLATVNITGDQNLTITAALDNSVVTVNAAGAGGKVAVSMGTGVTTTTGGAADDTITFGGTNFVNTSDTVDGGANTTTSPGDTLVAQSAQLTGTTATTALLVSNIETISVSNALAGNLDITHFGATNVNLAGTDNTVRTVTLPGGALVKLSAATGEDVTFAASPNTSSDALTVELSANFDTGGTDALLAATFESVTIEAKSAARTIGGATTLNNAGNVGLVTVVGSQDVTFTGVITAGAVDASGLTGTAKVVITAAMNSASTLTGGPGDDTLTGSTGNDNIIGGAGIDTITGGGGADAISGGTGVDIIMVAAAGLSTVTMEAGDVDGTAIDETFDFTASAAFIGTTTEDIAVVSDADLSAGGANNATAGDNIIILTGQFFANAAALDAATTADGLVNLATGNALFIYSSSATADARMAFCAVAASGDLSACVDLVTTVGLNVVEASTGFANADFVTN